MLNLGPIWYHSEPSDVPYSPNQLFGWDFFAVSYSKPALVSMPETHSSIIHYAETPEHIVVKNICKTFNE